MSRFTPQFLDQLRERTTLSALVGTRVKLTKAGREFKGLCPVHAEKSPSFTVNDEKGFAHCFGCGAHFDVFRWLTDMDGLGFVEAVEQLAAAAGIDLPAPDAAQAERAAQIETVRGALEAAQAIYARQLDQAGAVLEYLAGRGIGPAEIERWRIGFARGGDGSLRGSGITQAAGKAAGLLTERELIGSPGTTLGEQMWDRITIPIHDRRGRLAGFAGRVWPQRKTQAPKFINSPDGPLFDKGSLLFGQHLAAERLRAWRGGLRDTGGDGGTPSAKVGTGFAPGRGAPAAEGGRLIVCEGYFDVIALDGAGFAAVAPMGTALTARQLEALWRLHHRQVLLFDGDSAGQAAALRACKTALPALGPGREIAVACLPHGLDPDDLLREADGARELGAALDEALPLHGFVFQCVAGAADGSPEGTAAVWAELSELAAAIADDETRAQYLGTWRARFDRECSAAPVLAAGRDLHAVVRSDDGEYLFPESATDSEARLFAIIRAGLAKRAARREITEELGDLMKMAEAIGFVKAELTAAMRDIESDLAHGPGRREEAEMARVLYRRTLGIRGPMNEAMLPSVVEGRVRAPTAAIKRRETMHALLDAPALEAPSNSPEVV